MSGAEVVSVAELDRRLKRAVEGATGSFWVEGEVTSLKRAASGHTYFCLKDEREDAVIDCVMYRFDANRAKKHLADGTRLQVWGRATVWAPRGRLQLVGTFARPAGRGALLEALEALKKRLEAEGLFALEKKRPLPADPRVVGVVTSAHGAAFHDIRTVAFRRGNVKIVLSPALVQGDGAPDSIVEALELVERYPGLDVVIVGRGGGSGEDLAAFNDERVVRKVASLGVPVVSAVGHEVDVTLTDLAADVRAATPSQAAELVVPDARARRDALMRRRASLVRAMHSRLELERARLAHLSRGLGDPRFLLIERQQLLDELLARLRRRTERHLRVQAQRLAQHERRLL
ncbi:MAG TPA: exodeoxyribonuclease VII large subunit, partial [Polyangiaceae bacterium]